MNAIPRYESKLFLDPEVVLTPEKKLNKSLRDLFNMPDTPRKMNVIYLDTKKLDMFKEGWNVRFRKKEDAKKFEITYKKRYPITTTIDETLAIAALDGFDSNEGNFESEVDLGYKKKTLSFSHAITVKLSKYSGMEMPTLKECISNSKDDMPSKFKKLGKKFLSDSKAYGIVYAERYTGIFDGIKTTIEIWPVKKANSNDEKFDYIVEASFKTDDRSIAILKQQELQVIFESYNCFVPMDQMKTSLILERY